VLGSCGGGRDKSRQPILGNMAGQKADIVIVTNEDPYDDDPMEIINRVAQGVLEKGKILDLFSRLKNLSKNEKVNGIRGLAGDTGDGGDGNGLCYHAEKVDDENM